MTWKKDIHRHSLSKRSIRSSNGFTEGEPGVKKFITDRLEKRAAKAFQKHTPCSPADLKRLSITYTKEFGLKPDEADKRAKQFCSNERFFKKRPIESGKDAIYIYPQAFQRQAFADRKWITERISQAVHRVTKKEWSDKELNENVPLSNRLYKWSEAKYATPEMKAIAKEIDDRAKTQMEALKLAYTVIDDRYHDIYYTDSFKPGNQLWKRFLDLRSDEIWDRCNADKASGKQCYEPCHSQSSVLRALLLNTKFFKSEDVKWGRHWVATVPHEYLWVKIGKEWIAVDVFSADIGIPIGEHG